MGFLKRLFGGKQEDKKPKEKPAAPTPPPAPSKPHFPLGENIISDPDIKIFDDLGRYYPLPAGFAYQVGDQGEPVIVRMADGKTYTFLIEADMLTFSDKYVRADGRTAYKTTEVIKQK